MNKQPEALRLAKILQEESQDNPDDYRWQAGQEIERLHEANQAMLSALKLAVTLVHGDVIRVREIEKNKLFSAFKQWNKAIAKGEQA